MLWYISGALASCAEEGCSQKMTRKLYTPALATLIRLLVIISFLGLLSCVIMGIIKLRLSFPSFILSILVIKLFTTNDRFSPIAIYDNADVYNDWISLRLKRIENKNLFQT